VRNEEESAAGCSCCSCTVRVCVIDSDIVCVIKSFLSFNSATNNYLHIMHHRPPPSIHPSIHVS
jgi:hypothetical protein